MLLLLIFLLFQNSYSFHPNRYLILPGFGTSSSDYYNMKNNMIKLNYKTNILYVKKSSWLNYSIKNPKLIQKIIKRKCKPNDLFDWYLQELGQEIIKIKHENKNEKIILIAHSAGGWLARDFIGNGVFYVDYKPYKVQDYIQELITLGTPHQKPINIKNDLAFGCLDYVNQKYPGAYIEDIQYTSIGGKINIFNTFEEITQIPTSFINYYNKECIISDGLVPHSCIHLDGAKQINLNNVHHAFDSPYFKWYGHQDIIPQWLNLK